VTIAVLTAVGGTLKSATMPPIDTGSAATLNDISIWAKATVGVARGISWFCLPCSRVPALRNLAGNASPRCCRGAHHHVAVSI
jgi:hypothetical protein